MRRITFSFFTNFQDYAGASDFVLEFPGQIPGVPIEVPGFVEYAQVRRIPGVGFDPYVYVGGFLTINTLDGKCIRRWVYFHPCFWGL